jgi:hypothetical protein
LIEKCINTFNIAETTALIITDFLICSDAENSFQIDRNKNFMALKTFVQDKVQENAGIDMDKANLPAFIISLTCSETIF